MEGAVQGWIWVCNKKKEARTSQWGAKATSSLEKVLTLTITSHSAATIGLSGTQWSGKAHTELGYSQSSNEWHSADSYYSKKVKTEFN